MILRKLISRTNLGSTVSPCFTPFVLHNFLKHSSLFIPPAFPALLPRRPAELLRALRLLSVYGASWSVDNFPSRESLLFFLLFIS